MPPRPRATELKIMAFHDIVPYTCVYLDATWPDFFKGAERCIFSCEDRNQLIKKLQELWTTPSNKNPVLPALSVRTALDLYLTVMNFPPGSEIIMSALNIPDMVEVVEHHGLKIVPLDIVIETMEPKCQLIDSLVTNRTVAIILAHVYGKRFEMDKFIDAAKNYNLKVIEDCAECFSGYDYIGHPQSDLALFSFGAIKFYTSFGGAIAKIRDDDIYQKMVSLYGKWPIQSHKEYFSKIMKYSIIYLCLNHPRVVKIGLYVCRTLGVNHKKKFVEMLRGFPTGLMQKIRHRPNTALLHMLLRRHSSVTEADLSISKLKGDYVSARLNRNNVTLVGNSAYVKNYWLFPVLVENPEEVLSALNALGVDAYRGATQLNIIEPKNDQWRDLQKFVTHYPHEMKYLIDHVIYLPVNKLVPFHELDRICQALDEAVQNSSEKNLLPVSTTKPTVKLKLRSKL